MTDIHPYSFFLNHSADDAPMTAPQVRFSKGSHQAMLKFFSRLPVATLVISKNVLVIAGIIASLSVFITSFYKLEVNGPVYQRIKNGLDLTADILPPPLYVTEAYLASYQMRDPNRRESVATFRDRLEKLEQGFEARVAYWQGINLPADAAAVLNAQVVPPAREMFKMIRQDLLPAVEASDVARQNEVMAAIRPLFGQHEQAVEQLVTLATAEVKAAERFAAVEGASARRTIWAMGILSILIALAGAGIILTVVRGPLGRVTAALSHLAAGRKDISVEGTGGNGEIPRLWASVRDLCGALKAADQLAAEQERLKQQAATEQRAAMLKLADDFENQVGRLMGQLSSAASQLQSTATSMTRDVSATQEQVSVVSTSAEEASCNVQTVASAAEELAASIAEITQQVTRSTQISGQAVEATRGTSRIMDRLSVQAQKIDEILSLIASIADQTNLLALNATIEAARAGEAGKGFAVVAAEVKNLATQTANATNDISEQIKAVQEATREAVAAIQSVGVTIDEVGQTTTTIAAAVEEQGAATQEITRSVQSVASGTQQVSTRMHEVNRTAAATGASAAEVSAAATELAHQSVQLKQQVDRFLSSVRSA